MKVCSLYTFWNLLHFANVNECKTAYWLCDFVMRTKRRPVLREGITDKMFPRFEVNIATYQTVLNQFVWFHRYIRTFFMKHLNLKVQLFFSWGIKQKLVITTFVCFAQIIVWHGGNESMNPWMLVCSTDRFLITC